MDNSKGIIIININDVEETLSFTSMSKTHYIFLFK